MTAPVFPSAERTGRNTVTILVNESGRLIDLTTADAEALAASLMVATRAGARKPGDWA